jgi:hypothetical protein
MRNSQSSSTSNPFVVAPCLLPQLFAKRRAGRAGVVPSRELRQGEVTRRVLLRHKLSGGRIRDVTHSRIHIAGSGAGETRSKELELLRVVEIVVVENRNEGRVRGIDANVECGGAGERRGRETRSGKWRSNFASVFALVPPIMSTTIVSKIRAVCGTRLPSASSRACGLTCG